MPTTNQLTWQAIGDIILICAQVLAALALVWYTKRLVVETANYAKQVENQTILMKNNNESTQKQNKREQITKEIDNLVGILYSKTGHDITPTGYWQSIDSFKQLEPHYLDPEEEKNVLKFWEKIKRNLYLAPPELRLNIIKYLNIREEEAKELIKIRHHISRAIRERLGELNKSLGEDSKKGMEEETKIKNIFLPKFTRPGLKSFENLIECDLIKPMPLLERERTEYIKFWSECQRDKSIEGDLKNAINEYYVIINGAESKFQHPRTDLEIAVKARYFELIKKLENLNEDEIHK